jgi:predicted Holliday junction resolvase-like endonuclease
MEPTSFVLGMFTVVFAIMIAVIVAGVFKIKKIKQEIKLIHDSFEWESRNRSESLRDIHERISRMDEHARHYLEDQKREIISYIDSRIDKLTSKRDVLKG